MIIMKSLTSCIPLGQLRFESMYAQLFNAAAASRK